MSNIFPVMIAPRWKQLFTAAAIAPNLLCGPLGTAPAKPLPPGDSSLPVARAYPVSLRTWTGQTNLGLIGKDRFFGAPGQAPQFDQQLPRAAPRLPQGWTQSLLQTTLAPAAASPFAQNDWPAPRGMPYAASLRTWANGVPANLLGQDTMFGGPGRPLSNFDWQLPRTVRSALGRGQPPPLALIAVIPPPLVTADGRLPTAAVYPASLRTWSSSRSLLGLDTFFGGPGQPLANTEWRLAAGNASPPQSWAVNLLETTLSATAASIPFLQADWPLPQVSGRAHRSWSTSLVLTTLSRPIGARSPDGPAVGTRRAFGEAPGIPLTLLAAVSASPFTPLDSRLPAVANRLGQAWTQNLLLSTLYTAPSVPLNLYDSRLPTAKARLEQSWIGRNMVLGAPAQLSVSRTEFKAARDHVKFSAKDDDRKFTAARDHGKMIAQSDDEKFIADRDKTKFLPL